LSNKKQAEEVSLTQTVGGTSILNAANKTFAGLNSKKASPVIRGVLMTPQGVVATLDPNSLLDTAADLLVSTATATDAHIRSVAYDKVFGATPGTNLAGYNVGVVDLTTQGFKVILNGFTNKQEPAVLNCSFDPDSSTYFSKVLNTDPTKIEERGHFLYANWDIDKNVAAPSVSNLEHAGAALAGNYVNMIGFLVKGEGGRNASSAGKPDYEDFSSKFGTAKTPWIVSQFYSAQSNTDERPATASAGEAKKLFRLYSLDDGEVGNTKYRLLVSNLSYAGESEYGSFDLSLESFESDPVRGEVVVAWKNANLDPDSRNFIGRLIGDQHTYYDFEKDVARQRLRVEGQYPLKNSHVRIELSDELKQGLIPDDALPTGFQGHSHLFTSSDGNFIEQADLTTNRVFTATGDVVTETLSKAQIAPLDFVSSTSRKLTSSTEEADSVLPWGVKLSVRENKDSDRKELVEQVFNKSISSWTKFFPSFGSNPAWVTTDAAGESQNSFFTLEKILIPAGSVDTASKDIKNWDGASYKRDPSFDPSTGNERFVTISKDATGGNSRYLKFRCLFQGGFDGINIFDKEKAQLSGVASLREGQDENSSQKFTGPTVMAYRRAVDVLSDKSATEFQLLALPGQRAPQVTDYAISACEDRFDAMLIMDIAQKDAGGNLIESALTKPHVRQTISDFKSRALDTSFAAAYFPDVLVRRPSDRAPIVVPPSVGMLGVMSRNDSIADPWFAPAGLSRGRLNAIDSSVQMNRDLLDELYNEDINPVYVPAGRSGEVYAFGQKTLLQDSSALDRINVRRLLIDVRRKVKKVGEQLLFEPNRASTLSRFSALVEPIMANVQQRRGVERYKVQIDTTTTTQNDVENNTIRGKIYLQPTKSVEFISLDFVVANNIQ
jgi:phage tail sheath protein FI